MERRLERLGNQPILMSEYNARWVSVGVVGRRKREGKACQKGCG